MIYIYDEKKNIYFSFDGKINENLNKRGYNEIMSIRGQYFQEYTRGVIDLSITIEYMSEESYDNFKKIFLTSTNNLYIENDSDGKVYNKYYIKGDSYSFDKKENASTNEFYYEGSITLNKR